jgi:hypothetical protein
VLLAIDINVLAQQMALFIINHLVIHVGIEVIMMMNYSVFFENMVEKIEKKTQSKIFCSLKPN